MITERIPVEKDVLIWARESARLDEDAAAEKLSVSLSTLQKWENGDISPTIKQLRDVARVYRRPLGVLFLRKPPEDFEELPDYRSAKTVDVHNLSYELVCEIRRAHSQRRFLLSIAEISPQSVPTFENLPDLPKGADPEEIGRRLRSYLGFQGEELNSKQSDAYYMLSKWIRVLEIRGFQVIYLRKVHPTEINGLSISEFPYPVIAINGKDLPRRRLFTLLHELAHIALKQGGLCDMHEENYAMNRPPRNDVEAYCNAIAAATLMPAEEVYTLSRDSHLLKQALTNLGKLRDMANRFGASSEAFLLRLVTLELATWEDYWNTRPQLLKMYSKDMAKSAPSQKGGPSHYRVKARTLGHGYIASVLDAHASNNITTIEAARYLSLKHNQISSLAKELA